MYNCHICIYCSSPYAAVAFIEHAHLHSEDNKRGRTKGQVQTVEVVRILLHAVRVAIQEAEEHARQLLGARRDDDVDGQLHRAALCGVGNEKSASASTE